MRLAVLVVVVVAALAGCSGGGPPPTTAESDRAACRTEAATAVNRQNAKTGLAWMASPVTRWFAIDDREATCLSGKGYGRTRACTAQELAGGATAATRTVTAAGVRCTDPGRTS